MATIFDPPGDMCEQFRSLLASGRTIMAPGAFNPLAAVQAREAGFECVYFSGAAFSASMAMPDLGLFTLTELADAVRKLVSAGRLPAIVDVDTGFGEALNVARTIREMEDAGAAAIQIEDQQNPKKCGHLEGKQLIPAEEMAEKIAAAVKLRRGLSIVARTDARAVEGMESLIARARLYLEAGADVIFPEALQSEEEFALVAREVKAPLLANMTEFGKSPLLDIGRLEELGYRFVIYPVSALRIATRAVERFYRELKTRGSQADMVPEMLTRAELYRLIDYQGYVDFDAGLKRDH
jgi:methylisocitrate lyase